MDLLITVLLTGILGGALSFAWQRRQWLFEQKFQRLTADHEKQIQIVRALFRLIHKRIFSTRLYSDALISGPVNSIPEERRLYREAVATWSEESPGLIMQIRVHYSYSLAIDIERTFQEQFSRIDGLLRRMQLAFEANGSRSPLLAVRVDGMLHALNAQAQELMTSLLRRAEANKAVIEERPEISYSNIDVLSHVYLIKALFKSRQHA